ncbi:hypothetical protein [Chryseobacterium sp. MMS23-Vi53]|uniref:hypothetical protein n=1 Tax=Chryseobacterium sp. MMS23-Vi53 TaxID=3386644 RepID=UPI0039ED0B0B
MMRAKLIPGVPQQMKGGFHDTETCKKFDNPETATEQFEILKRKFLAVNDWRSFCGEGFADFKLFDSEGNFINRFPKEGDFIRIDIPGPGNSEAKGYDWVKILNISEYHYNEILECYSMVCQPSENPQDKNNFHIAHFYSQESTSTFIICRGKNFIKAGIYGRNEYPNFNSSFLNKIRNLFIAIGGMIGFSKIQWKRLTNGFIDIN